MKLRTLAWLIASLHWTSLAVAVEPEPIGQVATLPPAHPHWVWVPDRLLRHSLLFDGDSGEVLATLDNPSSSLSPRPPLLSRSRNELYSVDFAYARATRGERTDYVTLYDAETLLPAGEILLPRRTSESNAALGHVALLDDESSLLVFSQFPVPTATVVDLEGRRVTDEITIGGCAGLYPVDDASFATLCGDGTVVLHRLTPERRLAERIPSDRFFDVVEDPAFMAAGRSGSRWIFVTFEGRVIPIDFGSGAPRVEEAWSLLDERDRAEKWRPGGLQHVAVHRETNTLFVVMHQGGPSTHKDAGPEIWRFDLSSRERAGRIEVPNFAASFLAPMLELEADSFAESVLHWVVPRPGAHSIAVSQDAEPLLFVRHAEIGVVAVMDPESGEHVRTLEQAGLFGPTLGVH